MLITERSGFRSRLRLSNQASCGLSRQSRHKLVSKPIWVSVQLKLSHELKKSLWITILNQLWSFPYKHFLRCPSLVSTGVKHIWLRLQLSVLCIIGLGASEYANLVNCTEAWPKGSKVYWTPLGPYGNSAWKDFNRFRRQREGTWGYGLRKLVVPDEGTDLQTFIYLSAPCRQ